MSDNNHIDNVFANEASDLSRTEALIDTAKRLPAKAGTDPVMEGKGSPELEPFVDARAAGQFLGLRPRRVLELARQSEIPGHPLGRGERRVWRFRLSELAASLCTSRVDCRRQSPAPEQEK